MVTSFTPTRGEMPVLPEKSELTTPPLTPLFTLPFYFFAGSQDCHTISETTEHICKQTQDTGNGANT